MEPQRIAAILLVAAFAVGVVRTLWFAWRRAPQDRPRPWRIALLLALQLASALLLYRMMVPPRTPASVETLVVATAGATAGTAAGVHERLVALPEAPALAGAERVPDLATALRIHTGVARLRVIGHGLPARDRDVPHGLPIVFEPAPLPRGLVELAAPVDAYAGTDFRMHGRVEGVRGGSVELVDPSGQRIDREPLPADGRFGLLGATRTPGPATFRVRVFDAQGTRVEEATLPMTVAEARALRVLVLAGGPDAELKYLRRWALDSGTRMHAQIQLGGGIQAGDAPVAFNVATLKEFDALVIDERAWASLGDVRRRVALQAARDGLGVIVRITGPLSSPTRRSLATLGLRFAGETPPASFALASLEGDSDFAAARQGPGSKDAPNATALVDAPLPKLNRQPVALDVGGAHAWLRDADRRPLAAWWNVGRGRAAAWLPADTYQLVLLGRDDLHAALWSEAIGTVARPRIRPALAPPAGARTGERVAICGLGDAAAIVTPTGDSRPLPVDPATAARHCAGFWAGTAGWHVLRDGKAAVPFHVRAASQLPALAASQLREATQRLALTPASASIAPPSHPGTRWPWFLAWLLVASLLWWFERRRIGAGATPAAG